MWSNTDTPDRLNDLWGEYASDIHRFLAAVPPNDVWYCYLGSIGRALASREFERFQEPEFKRFPTGYSALAMFVVDQLHAERQIAKLTTFEKLKTEQENYKKYVRYKIPLAARVAEKGIAFDTLGRGDKYTEEDGFGVIVSDLIAGTSKDKKATPLSFLSRCEDVISLNETDVTTTVGVVDDIIEAIDYHFRENTSTWKDDGGEAWMDKRMAERRVGNVRKSIEDWTRTGASQRGGISTAG